MIPYRPLAAALLLAAAILAGARAGAAPLSLLGDRFRVEATWQTADGHTGTGTPVSLTTETGYFWFFSPGNVEVVVKALDACGGPSPRFWFFGTGLTDAQVTLTVTDEATGEKKTYQNLLGRPFLPIQDTDAFAGCGTPRCGQGAFEDLAATPRADANLEALAQAMGGGLTADPGVYARVVADFAAIRAQNIDLAGVDFAPAFDRQTLAVIFEPPAIQSVRNGTYHAWDCLNHWYGADPVQASADSNGLLLHFAKVLDTRRLVADYQALPGVEYAQIFGRNVFPVLQPLTPSLCGRIDGTTHHYYGRVPGIATFYYTSEPGAAPHYVGAERGGTSPSWAGDARVCFVRLVDSLEP